MKSKEVSSKWHSVSIKPGRKACPAVVAAENKRWLSRDAPSLPLAGCTQPRGCSCVYKHHEDRRSGEGRRAEEVDQFRVPHKPGKEQRIGRDRRSKPGD